MLDNHIVFDDISPLAATGQPAPGGSPGFAVPPPHLVPGRDIVQAQAGAAVMRALAAHVARADADPVATLAAVVRLLPPAGTSPPPDAVTTPAPADEAGHDRYFGILRDTGPAGIGFLRGVVTAAALFHAEAAGDQRFAAVAQGFTALLGDLAGASCQPTDGSRVETLAREAVDATRRWRLGHQIFAALTQGIIYALCGFEAAIRDDDAMAAEAALDLAADLLLASAAGFRFTGDFAPAAYRDLIRPSMAPPHVAEGFSGLLSADHRHLIQSLGRLRPQLTAASDRFAATHARLGRALRQVYDDHKFVCARFDGASVPSLRGTPGRHASGVETLDRFKRSRLRLVKPGSVGPRTDGA